MPGWALRQALRKTIAESAVSQESAFSASSSQADEPAAKSSIRLGMQLRHARLVKQLRLKDVARMSGLSESLISKFENNRATPSLNTLHKIVKVLGTSVAALLNEHASNSDVVLKPRQRPIIREVAMTAGADGMEAEVMIPMGASAMLEAFVIRLLPGGGSGGTRTHDGEEVGYVIKGELVLTVDGQAYHLQAGDSFFFSSSVPHEFSNPGAGPTEIVWVNTPPSL